MDRTLAAWFRALAAGRLFAPPFRVSVARPVFENVKLMLTRRVRGRTFLLRPSKRTNQIVRYVVAVMIGKWHVRVHALVAMSDHWHVCLSDPRGRVVDFQRDCHSFIARALNAACGDSEAMWSSKQTSHVVCVEPDDLIGRIAYAMANPVEAGLVRYGSSWPGVRHAWPCKPRVIRRPSGFFRGSDAGGDWPEEAALELSRPTGYDHLPDDELAAIVHTAIEAREARLRCEHDEAGRSFLGRKGVLATRRHARARSEESLFQLSPRVACRNKRLRTDYVTGLQRWLAAYRYARGRWVGGERDVVFPAGTYKLRVQFGATCAEAPG